MCKQMLRITSEANETETIDAPAIAQCWFYSIQSHKCMANIFMCSSCSENDVALYFIHSASAYLTIWRRNSFLVHLISSFSISIASFLIHSPEWKPISWFNRRACVFDWHNSTAMRVINACYYMKGHSTTPHIAQPTQYIYICILHLHFYF